MLKLLLMTIIVLMASSLLKAGAEGDRVPAASAEGVPPPVASASLLQDQPALPVWEVGAVGAYDASLADPEALMVEWQRRCFLYLWEQAEPTTGLVRDRAPADGGPEQIDPNDPPPASIAATGFALSSLPIAQGRGWITRDEAFDRAHITLQFLLERAPHHKGFFYHFMHLQTGARLWKSELSSIDTALLMAGVLTVGQHFAGTDVQRMANALYERVEWPWMLDGQDQLSMGWSPEHGFLPFRWDHYSEHLILQILGLGSPTHPLPARTWDAWQRGPTLRYGKFEFISYPPLFIHQFSHAWIDFRGQRDDYADYWQNSVLATRAHRRMFADHLSSGFKHYSDLLWGVTSSDSESGYLDWGGPEPDARINGTVVPCASGGSYPFLPEVVTATIVNMYQQYGGVAWKRYGFVDAFNPDTGWVADDCLGIDVGITLLAIENGQRGTIWRLFMSHDAARVGMQRARFRPHQDDPARLTSLYHDVFQAAPAIPTGITAVIDDDSAPRPE